MLDLILSLSEGNPGAATFCMEVMHSENASNCAMAVLQRMNYLGIRGDKLYMIWNDCCNRDTDKSIKVMLENSKEDLLKHLNYENGRGIPYDD